MHISNYDQNGDCVDFERAANDIMFTLIHRAKPFSADDFYVEARTVSMPPEQIRDYSSSMFRQFQSAGYIEKTDKYVLSKRNGSTPLPLWIAASDPDQESETK